MSKKSNFTAAVQPRWKNKNRDDFDEVWLHDAKIVCAAGDIMRHAVKNDKHMSLILYDTKHNQIKSNPSPKKFPGLVNRQRCRDRR